MFKKEKTQGSNHPSWGFPERHPGQPGPARAEALYYFRGAANVRQWPGVGERETALAPVCRAASFLLSLSQRIISWFPSSQVQIDFFFLKKKAFSPLILFCPQEQGQQDPKASFPL